MPVILYRDKDFQGPSVRLQPGFHAGQRALEGAARGSVTGEDLTREISSVRVPDRYVAVLYGGMTDSASSGARTLVGPTEVPDLGAIGMDDRTAAVQVYLYEPHLAAVPRDFGVTLYSGVGRTGMRTELGQGAYDRARLESDEVRLPRPLQSLCVGSNTLAILYSGDNFESAEDSVAIAGPRCVDDVGTIGMYGDDVTPKIRSIRVLYAAVAELRGATPTISAGLSAEETAVRTLGGAQLPLRNSGAAYNYPTTARADARAEAHRAMLLRAEAQQRVQRVAQLQAHRQAQLEAQLAQQREAEAKERRASGARALKVLLVILLVLVAVAVALGVKAYAARKNAHRLPPA